MDINTTVVASRLVAQQRAIDVIANNLANANTPGFRTERLQFSDWLSRQSGGPTIAYTQDRATWRDQQPGPLTHTGNPFDLALAGDGYFTVNTGRGPRLTRDGRFGPLPDGTLADGTGNPVLDTTGRPIQLAPTDTQVTVAGDGTISGPGGQIARVGVVRPDDPMKMQAEGNTLFQPQGGTTPVTSPGVVQGAIEGSNVQGVMEITLMINDLREFQIASQYIQAESDRQQAAIDKLLPQGS